MTIKGLLHTPPLSPPLHDLAFIHHHRSAFFHNALMSDPPAKSRNQPDDKFPAVLPDELITEVLSCADVKSLMQMRCVSKTWNAIITDPKFVKMHLKRASRNPSLTLFLSKSRIDGDNNVVPFPVHVESLVSDIVKPQKQIVTV
ncbi:hypothetical protein P8452_64569 [Trifolium repens]|nr:hypothetical protein P8452_64569 [Trifolium repens]